MTTKKVLYRVLALGWIPTLVLVGARGAPRRTWRHKNERRSP